MWSANIHAHPSTGRVDFTIFFRELGAIVGLTWSGGGSWDPSKSPVWTDDDALAAPLKAAALGTVDKSSFAAWARDWLQLLALR